MQKSERVGESSQPPRERELELHLVPENWPDDSDIQDLGERFRQYGYEANVHSLNRHLPDAATLLAPTLMVFVAEAVRQDIYPALRKLLRDWFTERPRDASFPFRVQVYDDQNELVDEFMVPRPPRHGRRRA
jgi:hypothetical protein